MIAARVTVWYPSDIPAKTITGILTDLNSDAFKLFLWYLKAPVFALALHPRGYYPATNGAYPFYLYQKIAGENTDICFIPLSLRLPKLPLGKVYVVTAEGATFFQSRSLSFDPESLQVVDDLSALNIVERLVLSCKDGTAQCRSECFAPAPRILETLWNIRSLLRVRSLYYGRKPATDEINKQILLESRMISGSLEHIIRKEVVQWEGLVAN